MVILTFGSTPVLEVLGCFFSFKRIFTEDVKFDEASVFEL